MTDKTADVLKFFASELEKFGSHISKSIKAYVEEGKELKSSFTVTGTKRKNSKEVRWFAWLVGVRLERKPPFCARGGCFKFGNAVDR